MPEAAPSTVEQTIRALPRPLPRQLHSLLTSTLATGEQLVWLAQPDARQRRRKGYLAMLFGLAILAFMVDAAPRAAGGMYWFVGVFTLIGMLLAFAPGLLQAAAESTVYVITAERALILRLGTIDAVKAYPLADMDELTTRFNSNGSGDLILKVEQIVDSDGHPDTREHGFEDVRDVGCAAYVLARLRNGDDAGTVLRQAALWDQA